MAYSSKFTEQTLNKKKKKKSYAEQVLSGDYKTLNNEIKVVETILKNEDIAPVTTTKTDNKKWYQKVFTKGAFDDGYDFGDVTKTILGTSADIAQDVSKGALKVIEAPLDIGTNLIASGVGLFSDKAENKIRDFADKDLSENVSNMIINTNPTGMLSNLVNGTPENIINPAGLEYDKDKSFVENLKTGAKKAFIDDVDTNDYEKSSLSGYYADKTTELVGYGLAMIFGGQALSGATATASIGSTTLGASANAGNIGLSLAGKTLNIPTLAITGGMASGLEEANSKEGVTELERWSKATSSGLIEGISEGLFGMFGVGGIKNEAGKEIFDAIGEKGAKLFSSRAGKVLVNAGIKSLGETSEEFISYTLNYFADNGIIDKLGESDFSNEWDWGEVGEQMALAFASSLILQGGGSVIENNSAIAEAEKQLGRKLTKQEKATVTQASIEGSLEEKIGDLQIQVEEQELERKEQVSDPIIEEAPVVEEQVIEQVEDIAPTTNEVIPPTVEQELTNITNQIDELETMLDTNLTATQQQEVLTQIKALEQRYNEILQQQGQTQNEAVFQTSNVKNNVEQQTNVQAEEIAPIQEANVEQISQPTTQQVESNLATEVESNAQNKEKTERKPIYHSTPMENIESIYKDGFNTDRAYFATNRDTAVGNYGGTFIELNENDFNLKDITNEVAEEGMPTTAMREKAKTEGYDGIKYQTSKQNSDVEIFNSDKLTNKLNENELENLEMASQLAGGVENLNPKDQERYNELKNKVKNAQQQEKKSPKTTEKEQKSDRKTPTQEELDNLEYIRKNKSGSEYASAYYDLEKKYGTGLFKGLNSYKSTGKAVVEEELAPVKETIEDLTDTIKETNKAVKNLAKEIKEVKKIAQEGKPLTIEDLEDFYKQTSADFRAITEQDAPMIQEDTTPEYEFQNSNESSETVESPLADRDIDEVGNRKIKAYQYEHPEVRPYFQEMAGYMLTDLNESTKGERTFNSQVYYDSNGESGWIGTKRQTTPDIANLLDNYNYTYADIEKGLKAIIEDHGAENIAVAKRIEFALDDRLRNGYTDVSGFEVPANEDYINLIKEQQWEDYYKSIPNNDIAPLESETIEDSVIAPVTENVAEIPTNRSLAIEQAPTGFDNGGPMIRVSPEMQKRTLNKDFDNKKIDWDSLDDTSQGEQQALIKKKLGSTLTDNSIKVEQILANEQAEKFGMEAEEQNNAETITQILTEKPQRVKGKWDNVNKMKKLGTIKLLQKDYYINKMARESGNQSLSEDSNNLRHANRIASQIAFDGVKEWNIDRTKSRRKGRFTSTQKAQGIEQIYETLENKGLSQQFDDYAYNLHNIDRMSIESKARDKMNNLKDTTLKGYSVQQIENMAKGIDPNEQQLDFDLRFDEQDIQKVIDASKEYVKLSKEHNKTVFGEQVTAEVSKENLKKYDEYKDTFDKQSQEITKLNDALLDFDVESGRMTAEEKAFIKERYPNYVPVYYAVDEVVKSGKKFKTKDIRIKEALEVAEGGHSEIIPLKDAMQIKTRQKVAQNLMNKLGLNIMHTLDKQGKLNVLSSDSVDVMERYTQSNEQLLSEMQDGGYALTVYENGNKIMFEVPLEIYEALKPSDIPVIDTLNTLVDIKRSLLTEYNLYFATRNIIRDMPTAFLQSQNSLQWLKNVPEAVRQVATKGQYYQLAQTLGAGNNDYANMNQRNFADIGPTNANEIRQQQEYQGNRFKTGWEAFKNWKGVKWIADINGFMEQVPRMAEFITSVDTSAQENINPLTGGKYTYAQDEITVNFGKGGDWTKTADRNVTNFMNASLQGSMKLVDTFRDAYAYKGAKGLANTIMKYGLTGASMIALMNWAWGDDDDYEELSDYVKNNYYILGKYGDGQFIKIPKGRTNAVVESIMNNGLSVASGDMSIQDALSDTISVIENNIAPTTFSEANLFSTLKQIYTNTSWYGEDLVPSRLQDLPAEEQYDETTDSFSIWLGQQLGISPYKINYFLNQSSGFVGDMILPLLTEQAETPINNDLTEMLLGQFYKDYTTDSTMKNQNVTDFYELVDELSVASKGKDATDEDSLKYKYISTVQSQMNDLYAEKREIQGNKDLTDSEKIEALRETQRQIDDLAKQGVEQYDKGIYTENYASIGGVQYQRKENEDGELYWSKVYDDEAEDLSSLGFTNTQINEYFSLRSEFNALNDTYYSSKEDLEKIYGKNSDEYDEAVDELYMSKKNTIIDTIINSDFSNEQKAYLYDKYYSSEALDTVIATGIDINYFLDYQKNDFKADYNSKGKVIPNSRKNKVINYINEYDLSIPEKAILIKSTNTFKFNDYNNEIVEYVESLDIGYEDKVYILNELDMTIDDNGYVVWE